MDPIAPPPRRRTCGLCSTQGHDRRHCRFAAAFLARHPEITDHAEVVLHLAEIRAIALEGLPDLPPPPPRVRCIMNRDHNEWGDRFQCHNLSVPGGQYCAGCDAGRPRLDLPRDQRCSAARCNCIIKERGLCRRHLKRDLTNRRQVYLNLSWGAAVGRMERDPTQWVQIVAEWNDHLPAEDLGGGRWWRTQIRHLRIRLAAEYFIRELWNQDHPHDQMDVNGVIDWHWNRRRAAPQHPPGSLAAFVADPQNVHTGVVSTQTGEGMKKLLAQPLHSRQSEVTRRFVEVLLARMVELKRCHPRDTIRITADFEHWYTTETCRTMQDMLYRRVFDGLAQTIHKVEDKSTRRELYIRLFEEMRDSLGMCCDGHITRLINVMAGFDEAFAPEKSVAEKVQELFAALSGKECGILEKVAEGVQGLRKLKVPEDEWEPWIDAL